MTGGEAAQSADFLDAVYGNFPLFIALIAALTFLLLARAFRSLIMPLKAVLLNLLSVGAAWGLLVLVWQHGWGSEAIWGIQATNAINVEMPIVVFAFLFGISMDYQVFILSRMREAYDRTGSTDAAVVEGIGRTGRLVTSAALILGLAFVAMSAGPGTEAKMFATALGGGILLDATSSAASWRRRPSRCSAAGTGGCRVAQRGCCGSNRRPRPSRSRPTERGPRASERAARSRPTSATHKRSCAALHPVPTGREVGFTPSRGHRLGENRHRRPGDARRGRDLDPPVRGIRRVGRRTRGAGVASVPAPSSRAWCRWPPRWRVARVRPSERRRSPISTAGATLPGAQDQEMARVTDRASSPAVGPLPDRRATARTDVDQAAGRRDCE